MNRAPEYRPRLSRGGSFRLAAEGRAVCYYLSVREGTAGSVLGTLGMPHVKTDGSGTLNLFADIGRALEVVTKEEERIVHHRVKTNRLVKRFAAYGVMVEARNQLEVCKYDAEMALHLVDLGLGTMDHYQKMEEKLGRLQTIYEEASRQNNRLRKGRLYLELATCMRNELKAREIHI
jgi:hypothetical protein